MARLFLAVAVLLAGQGLAGCCTPQKFGGVAASWHPPQHTDTWCWAASTEMVSDFFGHRVNQCDSSQNVHGRPTSCTGGCPAYCDCRGSCGATIAQIESNWTHWSFSYRHVATSLDWDTMKKTLSSTSACDKSPVQVIWWWTGGGGHVVTAYGYAETPTGNYVSYFNPWSPDCTDTCPESTSTTGGDDAVATLDWMVSTTDKAWGDTFHQFKYTGP
jgi:hypothetical protein